MEIKLYKLYDTATGKFNAGGDHWTKAGKCWNQQNHLTTKLTHDAQIFARLALGYRESYALRYDKEHRQVLYDRFIPESWVVIEITNNGVRELCKARDWLKR